MYLSQRNGWVFFGSRKHGPSFEKRGPEGYHSMKPEVKAKVPFSVYWVNHNSTHQTDKTEADSVLTPTPFPPTLPHPFSLSISQSVPCFTGKYLKLHKKENSRNKSSKSHKGIELETSHMEGHSRTDNPCSLFKNMLTGTLQDPVVHKLDNTIILVSSEQCHPTLEQQEPVLYMQHLLSPDHHQYVRLVRPFRSLDCFKIPQAIKVTISMETGFRHKNLLGCQHAQQMKDAQHYATKEQKT